MYTKIAGLSAVAILTATSALATTDATASTDLNLRNLPDPRGEILDVIPAEAMVSVSECTTSWCKVTYEGTEGWAYSPYLTASLESEPVVVYDNYERLEVQKIEPNDSQKEAAAAVSGLTAGAIVASAVGGPLAVAGAVAAGAIAGAESVPDETVTYVVSNPVPTIYVDGEVAVGAGIPQEVTLMSVPESDYSYVYLNGNPVLVNQDRQIVRVIR